MVKLHNIGIRGNVAKLINNFLFTRKVQLNINGHVGDNRQSSNYGLPQGSVISPVLFKIFVKDFVSELLELPNISILKFADDGTIKVSGPDSTSDVRYRRYRYLVSIPVSIPWYRKRYRYLKLVSR